jgi:hypothetical protein
LNRICGSKRLMVKAPEEHLEHLFVEEEVDRRDRLRVGAREVEDRDVALAPQGAGDLVGPLPIPSSSI